MIQGNPKPTIIWERDGTELELGAMYNTEEDYGNQRYWLAFKCLLLEDVGSYKVTARNHLGEDSAKAELDTHGNLIIIIIMILFNK